MRCPGCGKDHAPEMGLCPGCGRPLHSPKSPFGRMEAKLADLRNRYVSGAIPPAQYESAVIDLQLRDPSGSSWWLNGSGRWARWDGGRWVAAAPDQSHPPRRAFRWWIPVAGIAAVLAVGVVAVGVFLYAGWLDYAASPMLVEDVQRVGAAPGGYIRPPAQQTALAEHGAPEAFSILFYERPSPEGGLEDVRLETWDYYHDDLRLTFVNGALDEQETLGLGKAPAFASLPYTPELFTAYMSLDEVLAAAGLSSYIVVPLEREVVSDGAVYYGKGLTFGLKDGELRYVEALAVEGEG